MVKKYKKQYIESVECYFRELFYFKESTSSNVYFVNIFVYTNHSLYSTMNCINFDLRNRLTDEYSAMCTLLKININKLASSVQQKKSHQAIH